MWNHFTPLSIFFFQISTAGLCSLSEDPHSAQEPFPPIYNCSITLPSSGFPDSSTETVLKWMLNIDSLIFPEISEYGTADYVVDTLFYNAIPTIVQLCEESLLKIFTAPSIHVVHCLMIVYFPSTSRRRILDELGWRPCWTIFLTLHNASNEGRVLKSFATLIGVRMKLLKLYEGLVRVKRGTDTDQNQDVKYVISDFSRTRIFPFFEEDVQVNIKCSVTNLTNNPRLMNFPLKETAKLEVTVATPWDFYENHHLERLITNPKPIAPGVVDENMLKILAERLNISYSVVNPLRYYKTDQYGRRRDDGCWTGVVGMVMRKEAHFGIGAIGITYDRSQAVDFGTPFFMHDITFLTRRAGLKTKTLVVLHPFSYQVWATLVLCLLLVSTIFYFVGRLEFQIQHLDRLTLQNCLWNLFGTLTGKSLASAFTRHRTYSILSTAWLTFSVVILYSYSGNLTSFMIYPGRESQIENFMQLREAILERRFLCGTIEGTFMHTVLKLGQTGMLKDLGATAIQNLVKSEKEGFERAMNNKYAFIISRTHQESITQVLGPYRTFTSQDKLLAVYSGVVLPKGSPVRAELDKITERVFEAGLIDKWTTDKFYQLRLLANKQEDCDGHIRSLALDDMQGMFYLLFLGAVLSILAIFCELFRVNFARKIHYRAINISGQPQKYVM